MSDRSSEAYEFAKQGKVAELEALLEANTVNVDWVNEVRACTTFITYDISTTFESGVLNFIK